MCVWVAEKIKWDNTNESSLKTTKCVINSCANTHNNFKSTDKSGINSIVALLTEDIIMIYFGGIKSSQWFGKCLKINFWRDAKAGLSSELCGFQLWMWSHSILQEGLLLYFNIQPFLHVLNICQLVSWREF